MDVASLDLVFFILSVTFLILGLEALKSRDTASHVNIYKRLFQNAHKCTCVNKAHRIDIRMQRMLVESLELHIIRP